MRKKRVMKKEKPITGDKAKRYTFFTYYSKDNQCRVLQCTAFSLQEAEHKFVDKVNLPYIKVKGKEEWHNDIGKKWWKPLKLKNNRQLWIVDFLIRNNQIICYIKMSEAHDLNIMNTNIYTFALECIEGGPFITQCEASNIEQAISIWKRRIPYQRYLSKEFRNYLKLSTRKRFVVEELSEMNDVYQLNWEGSNFTLYLLNN